MLIAMYRGEQDSPRLPQGRCKKVLSENNRA